MPGNAPLSEMPSSKRSTKNCTLFFTAQAQSGNTSQGSMSRLFESMDHVFVLLQA